MLKLKKNKETEVKIPEMNVKMCELTLVGESPLLVHRFSEKAKREIEEKQQKKAKNAKVARDPHEEYLSSLYVMPGFKAGEKKARYGVPTGGVKNASVTACKFVDSFPMTRARGSFHVMDDGSGLIEIISKGGPVLDERMVRIGGFQKIATPRYRARFDDWKLKFKVRYNASMISPAQLVNLFENAGFAVGLCEHRPEKNGNLGMFKVQRGA